MQNAEPTKESFIQQPLGIILCLGKEAEDGHEEAHPADSKILCASVSGSGSSLGVCHSN
jgi:hypothetical protein